MKLVMEFEVPNEIVATRGSWTIVYDLFHLQGWPLGRGQRFPIRRVGTESEQLLTFLDAWVEDETGKHVA